MTSSNEYFIAIKYFFTIYISINNFIKEFLMKLRNIMLLTTAFSFFQVCPSFSMGDEEEEFKERFFVSVQKADKKEASFDATAFVKSFVPKDSSEDYMAKVVSVYEHTLTTKREISHDRPMLLPGVEQEDYGWNFPSMPRIQNELLQFCVQADDEVRIADVGAGFGFDSLFTLLTKRAKVTAFEKPKAQFENLKFTVVQSILQNVDKNFPVSKFQPLNRDFLELKMSPALRHTFDGINANKVIHFFDPEQTNTFKDKISFLLKSGGRLFLTCLTPTPRSMIEDFMNSKAQEELFPGYIFYREKSKLSGYDDISESEWIDVRRPMNEKSAYFLQNYRREGDKEFVITDRVMHYHNRETLARVLGEEFNILKTFIIPPEENRGRDYMISIVAEKK